MFSTSRPLRCGFWNCLFISWLACLCLSSAAAQALRGVDCRLLWFDPARPPLALEGPGADGGVVACAFRANTLSEVHRMLASDNTLRLVNKEDRAPVVDVKIPAGVNKAILVFLPADQNPDANPPGQPRVFVIDESPQNFPLGGAFIANFYLGDIRIVMGEHRTQLRPGGTVSLKQPAQRDDFNMAPVIVQFAQGDDWRTASESAVRFIPETRYLILAYVDPASGRPRIATYTDVVAAAPAD